MVEIIKKSFEHDYKEALAGFGNGDYVLFLRNVRVAFEWLCKLIANDVLEDDILFQDLLEGNKTITCDWNLGVCSISAGDGVAKEESSLAFLARNSIYYKKPQLLTNDKAMKRVKKAIDQTFQDIFFWYGKISGEGSHSKIEEDARMQSEAIASLLPIWIKELKKVLSTETVAFLENMPTPKLADISISSEKGIEENNDYIVLDELTNRFEQLPGVNYIALLPECLTDKYGKPLSSSQMQEFFRIQWNFVVDLNKKTEDGLFEQAPAAQKSSLRIITKEVFVWPKAI